VIVLLRALNPVEYVKGGGQSMMKTDVCLSSKSGCFAKSATCRNLTSGRLSHVNWAHDPASLGFSFLVRCLLPLAA